jgi:hypothetical protein
VVLAFGGAAAYHVVAVFAPAIGRGASMGRHLVFAVIDAGLAIGLSYRPRWLVLVFLVLTGQVLYGHGGYARHVWQTQHRVAWLDGSVTAAVLAVLVMLLTMRHGADT